MSNGAWQRLCEILTTDIPIAEFTQGTVDTCKTFIELAKSINENRSLSELAPLIGQISSVLDVLNLPIVQVVGSALPVVGIASKLLQFSLDRAKVELSFADCVELVGQEAYLESFKNFLNRAENQQLLKKLEDAKASDRLQKKIAELGRSLSLNDYEARDVLDCFHESKLAKAINPILVERLIESGMGEAAAKIVVERVSRLTHRETKFVLTKLKDKVESLRAIYGGDWQSDSKTYLSIDRYLEEVIAGKPKEKVFEEDFGFEDIYVEMQLKVIAENTSNSEPQFIEEWALGLLNDESKSGQVLFIQGEPGRGKSVFCRMFADRVRRELYPIWIPILIRLRDITNFADDFGTLLRDAVNTDFALNDNGWLTDRNTRFLFILDGFDELLLQHGRDRSLKGFLGRVSSFQENCKTLKERGHRIIITGRPLALFGIEREMPPNLERVRILDMCPEVQASWLKKWAVLKGEDAAQKFQAFISDDKCPEQVKTLAKEPLLLYLLAAMHGDDRFKIEDFQKAGNSAKILIYDQTLDWVLTKQRNDKLNPRLTGLDAEDIRDILKEAGLCVAQSGGECASLAVIEERLTTDLRDRLKDARKALEKDTLSVALATFYLKAADGKNNSMEFLHKSFGEFLCAERLVDSLLAWSRQITPDSRKPNKQIFEVENENLEWQVYDLLGFGALTSEIVEYLTALIEREFAGKDDDFMRLFERLYGFYWAWSDGEFIDAVESDREPIPLRKARPMQKQGVEIGQRKVDVYTGLNVLILMFTFHRYAHQSDSELKDKVSFHPCKYSSKDGAIDDSSRLLRIIGYGQTLRDGGFNNVVGKFLTNVNLSRADLSHANLIDADFSGADLSGANFLGADLSGANFLGADLNGANFFAANLFGADLRGKTLNGANLRCAYFFGVNLSGADLRLKNLSGTDFSAANLSSANLSGANLLDVSLVDTDLDGANLNNTDLSGADFTRAYLSGANLSGANLSNILSDDTHWSNAMGLDRAINISDSLVLNPQFRAAVLLCNGSDLVVSGDVDGAITAYNEAQTLDPNLEISAFFWFRLGWSGSLHNRAADVLFACEKLVELAKLWVSQDTRGLARALTGNFAGAIEDFEAAINSGELEGEMLEKRERWLEALKSGINPFTPEELEALRASEGATS